jgi:hypothetical protein
MMRIVVILVLMVPSVVFADGMAFSVVGASMDVRASEQRAVMWLRDGEWEMHIQPVFPREAGGAAWVVPFSVQPTVEPGNADFFDQLELITSPVFAKVCSEDSGGLFCLGCLGADRGLGAEGEATGTARVIVWEQGKVGDLDYVVLSAFSGDSLVDWLGAEGYQLPAGAQAVIADYETEGVYFFIARLAEDADPQKPLAPVRFILPDLHPPTYPLRLTALGVPPGQELDLTLWVVFPEDQGYEPDSHPVGKLGTVPKDAGEFERALDKVFTDIPGQLALLYGWMIRYSCVLDGNFCWDFPCVSFGDLGIDVPAWSDEILEINREGHRLFRYQARLSAATLAKDLTLARIDPAYLDWASNIYMEYTCKENVAAMTWLLVMGMGLGLLRRIRRA